MSTRKEILLTQLKACHNQDGWFAPLEFALRGVAADQAVQRGLRSSNSILGIVKHLIFWNERYLLRFQRGSLPPLEISNDETFQYNVPDEILENWDPLKSKLYNVFSQWEQAIMECDDSKLDSRTHPDRDELWWMSLSHLAIHNAYHIGQIVHIRKEQGSWEAWE
jgi:uncharacterized damage-inducible protein DinB